ncbi:MAG: zinc-binding alcohol dehydrogenase family protein [Alphaproteobacteria bacterium]|nr:zinc-binding alcohol dehydrogenase family protein [Alphaproteobacteria bacterium]
MARRIVMFAYGPPEVMRLTEVELPPVGPTEVRFRVAAAAVNWSDVMIRAGHWPVRSKNPWPYTPGLEAVGQVIDVGAAVADIKRGDAVITMMQKLGGIWGIRPGGYQEFVTVDAEAVAVLPSGVPLHDMAALGLAAVTAHHGLDRMATERGHRVVIHGASGGVGSAAIALAKARGAYVIATSSSDRKFDFLRRMGADEVVDLSRQRLIEAVGEGTVDGVLETVGRATFADSAAALKPTGRLCLVGATAGPELAFSAWHLIEGQTMTGWSSETLTGAGLRAAIGEFVSLLARGRLAVPEHESISLAEVAHAHARMEAGAMRGRILLTP